MECFRVELDSLYPTNALVTDITFTDSTVDLRTVLKAFPNVFTLTFITCKVKNCYLARHLRVIGACTKGTFENGIWDQDNIMESLADGFSECEESVIALSTVFGATAVALLTLIIQKLWKCYKKDKICGFCDRTTNGDSGVEGPKEFKSTTTNTDVELANDPGTTSCERSPKSRYGSSRTYRSSPRSRYELESDLRCSERKEHSSCYSNKSDVQDLGSLSQICPTSQSSKADSHYKSKSSSSHDFEDSDLDSRAAQKQPSPTLSRSCLKTSTPMYTAANPEKASKHLSSSATSDYYTSSSAQRDLDSGLVETQPKTVFFRDKTRRELEKDLERLEADIDGLSQTNNKPRRFRELSTMTREFENNFRDDERDQHKLRTKYWLRSDELTKKKEEEDYYR